MSVSPLCTKWVNSYTCMPTKNSPHMMVMPSHSSSPLRLPRCALASASTTNSELNSSSAVPSVTSGISMMGSKCWPAGETHSWWGNGPGPVSHVSLCTR